MAYNLLKPDNIVGESWQIVNDNTEALRGNFAGAAYPSNPIKGQRAYISYKWYTYNGSDWVSDDALHNHDTKYYQKSEVDTKVNTINNAINSKAASTHSHDFNSISNVPTSMPANGGSATTAVRLQNARKINGVYFDGTSDIDFSANTYVSPSHGASAGSIINYNHNLNTDPSRLDVKIIATVTTAHSGWSVGDKVIAPISSNLYISGAQPNLREHGIVCMLTNNTITAIHGNLNDLTYVGRTGVAGQNLLRSNCSYTITVNKI